MLAAAACVTCFVPLQATELAATALEHSTIEVDGMHQALQGALHAIVPAKCTDDADRLADDDAAPSHLTNVGFTPEARRQLAVRVVANLSLGSVLCTAQLQCRQINSNMLHVCSVCLHTQAK